MRALRGGVLGSLAVAACASAGQRTPAMSCPEGAPAHARPLLSDSVEALAGDYDVALVTTTQPLRDTPILHLHLHLAPTDSAELRPARAIGPTHQPWHGTQRLTGTLAVPGAPDASENRVVRLRDGALVEDERHLCLDCSGRTLWIRWTTSGSFGGDWAKDFGVGVLQTADGHMYTAAVGRFCATRVPAARARDA